MKTPEQYRKYVDSIRNKIIHKIPLTEHERYIVSEYNIVEAPELLDLNSKSFDTVKKEYPFFVFYQEQIMRESTQILCEWILEVQKQKKPNLDFDAIPSDHDVWNNSAISYLDVQKHVGKEKLSEIITPSNLLELLQKISYHDFKKIKSDAIIIKLWQYVANNQDVQHKFLEQLESLSGWSSSSDTVDFALLPSEKISNEERAFISQCALTILQTVKHKTCSHQQSMLLVNLLSEQDKKQYVEHVIHHKKRFHFLELCDKIAHIPGLEHVLEIFQFKKKLDIADWPDAIKKEMGILYALNGSSSRLYKSDDVFMNGYHYGTTLKNLGLNKNSYIDGRKAATIPQEETPLLL